MNRRGFFGFLGGVAATAVLDPERLLWVPGTKTIFLPSDEQVLRANAIRRNTAALKAQMEYIRASLPAIFEQERIDQDKFFRKFTHDDALIRGYCVSSRPVRVPFQVGA